MSLTGKAMTTLGFSPRVRYSIALLLLAGLPIAAFPQNSETTRSALVEIVENRDRCVEYVSIAKKELKGESLMRARSLYAEAYSSNSAWVATVKTAIRDGRAKKLEADALYERTSSRAAAASKDFVEYVKAQLASPAYTQPKKETPAVAPVAGSAAVALVLVPLADLGIKLWKAHNEKQLAERQVAADGFGKDASWKPWDDLGRGSL
jgi:hypothetical protein